MEKRKRRICFVITIIGIILLIVVQTVITIIDDAEEKHENYIKSNIIIAAKKCVSDKKCKEEDMTILELIEGEYLDGYFMNEIEEYSTASKIKYPSYEVILIKREGM